MPVNGIELKEGQRWRTQNYGIVTIVKPGLNEEYPWRFIEEGQEEDLSITDDGKYWSDDNFPILLELIKDVTMKSTNKFNPVPGDKIICNNGEEFICCTKEFLVSKGCCAFGDGVIFGFFDNPDNGTTGISWNAWNDAGGSTGESVAWSIQEVIPQSVESSADKKEEVKEEPRYTVEEVLEAIQLVTPNEAPWNWVPEIKEHLNKVKDPQYQEYLRLRAIYEP